MCWKALQIARVSLYHGIPHHTNYPVWSLPGLGERQIVTALGNKFVNPLKMQKDPNLPWHCMLYNYTHQLSPR